MTHSASLMSALEVLRSVARADPDRARIANACGFSKADVALGHRLASLHPFAYQRNPLLGEQAIALAARDRRQVSPALAFEAEAVDQPDLFA